MSTMRLQQQQNRNYKTVNKGLVQYFVDWNIHIMVSKHILRLQKSVNTVIESIN